MVFLRDGERESGRVGEPEQKMPFSRFTYQTQTNKKEFDANNDKTQTHTHTDTDTVTLTEVIFV